METSTSHSADITSVGGAAFDVFIQAPHKTESDEQCGQHIAFPLGAKIKVESVIQSCGGGATNTSVGFSRLGMRARFCGVIGDDEWGKNIQKNLEEQGVLTDAAVIVEDEISSFSIILVDPDSGRRTVLYSPNVNAHLTDAIFSKESIKDGKWLFLNHLTDVSCVILDDCLDLVTKPHGLQFAWNPGGSQIRDGHKDPLLSRMLQQTDILFLNAEEAMTFTRTSTIHDALREGISAGVRIMCITDGKKGAYVSDGTSIWFCMPEEGTKIVDATGAGDGFAVGVTWGVFASRDLSEALRAGMLNAASVIGKVGTQAGLLTLSEMEEKLQSTRLSVTKDSL